MLAIKTNHRHPASPLIALVGEQLLDCARSEDRRYRSVRAIEATETIGRIVSYLITYLPGDPVPDEIWESADNYCRTVRQDLESQAVARN